MGTGSKIIGNKPILCFYIDMVQINNSLKRVVAIFAHNESRRIIACLEALRLSPLPDGTTCYVIANGCTDDTVIRATEYAQRASWVKVIDLKTGDKANAWNYFVHEVAAEAGIYFFTDGDCQIESGALQHLEERLLSNPDINAVSGVPSSRNLSLGIFRSTITSKGGFAGNLYALSQDFVTRIRIKQIRLPHGLIGD
ncbi:glycosyltransferase, partial [uncultured Nitrosomonas sp.]|uniref:glycosyltransferase n=1 Tax=uncultured Nitrosomonas sp. TaxID=156424 RepID=UPI002608BAFA